MNEKCNRITKRELFLLIIIVAVAAIFYLFNLSRFSKPAAVIEIAIVDEHSNRQIINSFDLHEDTEYTIQTGRSLTDGTEEFNQLIIQDGSAWISEANCPNHDCVKKGKIQENGEMLVCIPHRLTVTIRTE